MHEWTRTLSERRQASECGIAHGIGNDAFRASLRNNSFTCQEISFTSASASDLKTTWKTSCICELKPTFLSHAISKFLRLLLLGCSDLCNGENFKCEERKHVAQFSPPESSTKPVVERPRSGYDCRFGTSVDGRLPRRFAYDCDYCTVSLKFYSLSPLKNK